MADSKLLEILHKGVGAWNQWWKENVNGIGFDLSNADLRSANLNNAIFTFGNLNGVNLSNAQLQNAVFNMSSLSGANFSSANLEGAGFFGARITRANLAGARLVRASMNGADLTASNLEGVQCAEANLSQTICYRTKLAGADFTNAKLFGTRLWQSDLKRAKLHGAFLYGVNLTNSDLTEVEIGLTTFSNCDIGRARGLETVKHENPSSIGIDTIFHSENKIPEIFLRGCGLPEAFIRQIPLLFASVEPSQFYKCFISFTEADGKFSEKLYNDLQTKGVRCWRWKEDAKWGKTLMRSIDEAVREYDKLIIICSEQSLNAPAVIREIERALQKEDELARQGKEGEVLFPIRLDDYIFTGWDHYRKADVTAKHIGDFRRWESHSSYQKAFERLLSDLKAGRNQAAEG